MSQSELVGDSCCGGGSGGDGGGDDGSGDDGGGRGGGYCSDNPGDGDSFDVGNVNDDGSDDGNREVSVR